ncbi:MAG: flagellar export protein FliJ [Deltaproteobacteria bacterium RIFCSPLOWO2_02_FULL_53_8]|nr:MAG: flagellar export protein FliJ [Deltaproteobacteria bacterium RIFCSPLOWO2_02_FULL_53_8]
MRKFAFKLEALHEYRQMMEGMTLRDLAVVVQRLEEEELKLDVLKELYHKSSKDADIAKAASDIRGFRRYADYLEGLKRHIEEQGRVIDIFREEYRLKRDELSGISRDRKALDKVKESGHRRHVKERDCAEQKEIDEISASESARKK